MSRFEETLRTIPPITLGTIALCCILYILQVVLDIRVTNWTLSPALVLSQPYRVITSALLHNGPLHLGMNMMSMYAIGMMVEQRLGSLRLLFTIVASIGMTAAVHVSIAWVAAFAVNVMGPMHQHSIGFSGVLFHLSVLECNMGSHASRSLFGFVEVPAKMYPFAL